VIEIHLDLGNQKENQLKIKSIIKIHSICRIKLIAILWKLIQDLILLILWIWDKLIL